VWGVVERMRMVRGPRVRGVVEDGGVCVRIGVGGDWW